MASSVLLKQGTPCCSSSGFVGRKKCVGDGLRPAAVGVSPFEQGTPRLSFSVGRRHRKLGISMDGSSSSTKAGSSPGSTHLGQLAGKLPSKQLDVSLENQQEAQKPESLQLEGDEQDFDGEVEEEVVIVSEPVRQHSGVYQATIRQDIPPVQTHSSNSGAPLFWIGVGVALAVVGRFIVKRSTKTVSDQAMSAALKMLLSGAGNGGQPGFPGMPGMPGASQPNPMGAGGFPGFPPGFPGMPPMPPPAPKPQPSKAVVMDTTATPVQPAPRVEPSETKQSGAAQPAPAAAQSSEAAAKPKRASFRDVNEEELKKEQQKIKDAPNRPFVQEAEVINEGTSTSGGASSGSPFNTGASGPGLTVEALEKMMDDPMVQQMIYPHLPEEMRNPQTFKWMMSNPMYKQQLEQMLQNMGGNEELLNSLNMDSPEVKEQFDKIGMTPEEVISKILSQPDVAMGFQNPKVQAAIMDVTSNPMNILKYQNDKEVMDIFDKIQTLFPNVQ